jgi:hypothetical protein
MTTANRYYSNLMVFGRESPHRRIDEAEQFRAVLEILAPCLSLAHFALRCRGYIIDDKGGNIAPAGGRLSNKIIEEWIAALNGGRFETFEIYGPRWGNDALPLLYVGIHKLWEYGRHGYVAGTRAGAGSNLTLALHKDLSVGNRITSGVDMLVNSLRALATHLPVLYGYIEESTEWDKPFGRTTLREDMINIQWSNILKAYKRASRRMDQSIHHLCWANVLSAGHFRSGDPTVLPASAVQRVEAWGEDLYFVQFVEDPQENPQLQKALTQYFNVLPAESISRTV